MKDKLFVRFTLIFGISLSSISLVIITISERLYPTIPLVVFLFAGGMTILTIYYRPLSKKGFIGATSITILFSIVLSVLIFNFPDTLIGVDTLTFADWLNDSITEGSPKASDSFYEKASSFIVIGMFLSLVMDITVRTTFLIISVNFTILLTLGALIITIILYSEDIWTEGYLAILLISFAPMSTFLTYWPIAQNYGLVYTLFVLYSISKVIASKRIIWPIITVILLVILAYTHKLPLIVLSVFFIVYVFHITLIDRERTLSRMGGILGIITIMLSMIQISWLTHLILNLRLYVIGSFYSLISDTDSTISPTNARPAEQGAYVLFGNRAYLLIIITIGGISWLYILKQKDNKIPMNNILLIYTGILSVIVALLGLMHLLSASPIHFSRLQFMNEPLLLILFAIFWVRVGNNKRSIELIKISIIIFLIIMFSFSILGVPDHPAETRYYLTKGEISAGEFTDTYGNTSVRVDEYAYLHYTYRFDDNPYKILDSYLLDNGFNELNNEYIIYRTEVSVYRSTRYYSEVFYELIWDAELELNMTKDKTYTNGAANIYH